MQQVLIDICPDKVWANTFNSVPFWRQVFHVVYFIDFWMRESYEIDKEWHVMFFDDAYTPDLDAENFDGLFIAKASMAEYLEKIQIKTTKIFDGLNDKILRETIAFENSEFTYADIISTQIRHIMYNIGYLNGILRCLGLPESDWFAYNEAEGS